MGKEKKNESAKKGSGWSSSASSDINVSQEDIQSESEDRFQVVIEPIGEESDFEDSSTFRDVLGEVHEEEEEVIFYRTLFGHPPPHALG